MIYYITFRNFSQSIKAISSKVWTIDRVNQTAIRCMMHAHPLFKHDVIYQP